MSRLDNLTTALERQMSLYKETKDIRHLADVVLACDNIETEVNGLKHWAVFLIANKISKAE